MTAKFFPYSNNTVIGGCFSGQLVIWDFREKTMPVQRSGMSGQGHKYPVCSINVVGTQMTNNVVSFSNNGTMCIWDIKQFSKPIKNSTQLVASRQTKSNNLTAQMSQSRKDGNGCVI
jgi:dynein intermediate chain